MMWVRLTVVIALFIAAACARQGAPEPTTAPAQAPQQHAEPAEPHDDRAPSVENWQTWEELSVERIFSQGHSEMWVEVYVPSEHAAAYLDEEAPVPDDMVIVKPQYATETAPEPENLTVMIRDEAAETGWLWGMYDPSGREAMDLGQIEMCTGCHMAAGEDMLFRRLE